MVWPVLGMVVLGPNTSTAAQASGGPDVRVWQQNHTAPPRRHMVALDGRPGTLPAYGQHDKPTRKGTL